MKDKGICKRVFGAFVAPAAVVLSLFAAGCDRTGGPDERTVAGGINFNVTSGDADSKSCIRTEESVYVECDGGVKTEYGDYNSDNTWQMIKWIADSDSLTVLCDAATVGGSTALHSADYKVTAVTNSDAASHTSTASVTSASPLEWGTGTHTFYGMYPTAVKNAGAAIASASGTKATISGVIPAENGGAATIYKYDAVLRKLHPDMRYAYMYAMARAESGAAGVSLDFKPLFTALEFSIAAEATTWKMERAVLMTQSSGGADTGKLTGSFSATLDYAADAELPAAVAVTSAVDSIAVDVRALNGNDGIVMTAPVALTFLTLPLSHTKISLKLIFDDGTGTKMTRTLRLKTAAATESDWGVTVARFEKLRITDLQAPGIPSDYFLEVIPPQPFPYVGGSRNYTVTSYKIQQGSTAKVPVNWKVQVISAIEGTDTTWVDAPASAYGWLTSSGSFNQVVNPGSAITTTVSMTATQAPATGDVSDVHAMILKTSAHPAQSQNTNSGKSKETAIDLSLWDLQGNQINRTTANCYVVCAPGWYKFPLVYGNALKNGAANPASYDLSGAVAGGKVPSGLNNMLYNFVRHDAQAIADPWIKNNGVTVDSVELIWQDAMDLIDVSSLDIQEDYVYFEIPAKSIRQGSALLAARASGVEGALWSWHIWVIDNAMQPVRVTNHNGREYDFLPVNLGWFDGGYTSTYAPRNSILRVVQVENGGKTNYCDVNQLGLAPNLRLGGGMLYQWGRKDPIHTFIVTPGQGPVFANKVWYDSEGNVDGSLNNGRQPIPYSDLFGSYSTEQEKLASLLRNPGIFHNGSVMATRMLNLWSANNAEQSAFSPNAPPTDRNVVKTVYDPSPIGYCIPHLGAFSGFVSNGYIGSGQNTEICNHETAQGTDYGYLLWSNSAQSETLFLPFFPHRLYNTSLKSGDYTVTLWTSDKYPTDERYSYYFLGNRTSEGEAQLHVRQRTNTYNALSVRPVREDSPAFVLAPGAATGGQGTIYINGPGGWD